MKIFEVTVTGWKPVMMGDEPDAVHAGVILGVRAENEEEAKKVALEMARGMGIWDAEVDEVKEGNRVGVIDTWETY